MSTDTTAAPKAPKVRKVTLAGNVPEALREAVETYRWDPKVRKSVSDVVEEALTEWAQKRNLLPKPAADDKVAPKA